MSLKEKPLIFDGAMGTYYPTVSENPQAKCELANLYDRNTILQIHKEYIAAGCEAIKTNTFGANRVSLECDLNQVKEVITSGFDIALEATQNTDIKVFADIGPIPIGEDEITLDAYKEIVDIFLELGANNFIFETFSNDAYLLEISKYIKAQNSDAYIIVGFAVSPEGHTRGGKHGKKLIDTFLSKPYIDACGFNCFSGPYHLLQLIKTIDIQNRNILIMPNSGYPTIVNNRTFFDDTTDYFALQMLEIAKQGVAIVGGCCGTTPDYIKETVKKLKGFVPQDMIASKQKQKSPVKKENHTNVLLDKMSSGQKIIAVELDPPVDTEIEFFMNSAQRLKDHGVDAITIADCPIARARVDSSILACKLKRELGITPIPHMTCRDRNINATKALLLGLNIEDVNNVLVVTGDPIPSAERDEIKALFSFNSSMLANYITTLNETSFSHPFNICGALNINARNFNNELAKAKRKVENGMSMFLTQPVLTPEGLENLKLAHKELDAKILGGIIPVVSYRNACFMNNEISGINVSQEIIDQYKDVSKEEAKQLAIKISTETAQAIEPYVDGYYLITPFKRIDIISEIIDNIEQEMK